MKSFSKNSVNLAYEGDLDKCSMPGFLFYMGGCIYIYKYFLESFSTFYLFTANVCCICLFPKSFLSEKVQINILCISTAVTTGMPNIVYTSYFLLLRKSKFIKCFFSTIYLVKHFNSNKRIFK